MTTKEKLLLVFIAGAEVCICSVVLWKIYKKILDDRQAFAQSHLAQIKKEDVVFSSDSPLKYYYTLKPNLPESDSPDWLPYKAVYTINSDGLNERRDYTVAKDQGTFRIVTLGDSFTFGHFVNTSDNWTEKLEDLLHNDAKCRGKNFEVINLV